MKCLSEGFYGQCEHRVERRHFPLGLMEHNSNKAIVVTKYEDSIIESPLLPGHNGKLKKISTLLK